MVRKGWTITRHLHWFILFLAACATSKAAPAASPEEVLNRIEWTFTGATTVSSRIKVTSSNKEFVISILLKRDNKVFYENLMPAPDLPLTPEKELILKMFKPADGGPMKGVSISDGKRMKDFLGGHELGSEHDALKDYGKLVTIALARGDVMETESAYIGRTNWPDLDFNKRLAVTDLKTGADDGSAKTITYRLNRLKYPSDPGPERFLVVQVSYDPKTYRPMRRTCMPEGGMPFTEVFEELVLNGDVPDERFVVPRRTEAPPDPMPVVSALKSIAAAEVDFHDNDRDGNRANDFWVGDVSGLYRLLVDGREIREMTIDLARADAAPLDSAELSAPLKKPVPVYGYLFVALKWFENDGKTQRYDNGTHRNISRYGIAAYPAQYPKAETFTFIMSEDGSIFRKDTRGQVPEAFPQDPGKSGWERVP